MHGRRLGGRRIDHDGVLHGAMLFELGDHVGHGGLFLADGNVDALDAGSHLVDDRVDGDGRFTDLAVADDQFALAATDRDHGVDRLQAGLHRLRYRLAPDHTGRHLFNRGESIVLDRTLAVDRLAQRVDHAA